MGRDQTRVSSLAGGPGDGAGWARAYRLEWGEVVRQRIRRLRLARGWKLHELQGQVRKPDGGFYSGGYFSRIESGWTSPPLYVYLKIAEALEVHPGDLLGVEEFDRALTREQAVLLRVVERLGLAPDEVIVRLAAADAGVVG
jgi:transcriptional regulator with XRE-family HTH domain